MRRHAPYVRIIRLMSRNRRRPSRRPGSLDKVGLVVGRVGHGGGTKHTHPGSFLLCRTSILATVDRFSEWAAAAGLCYGSGSEPVLATCIDKSDD